MPEEATGSRAGDTAGSVFQRNASAPAVTPEVINSSYGVFRESLGDIGKDKSLEPIKDFKGLTDSYINAQKLLGSSIRLPKKDGKPEERQKIVTDIMAKLRSEGILEPPPESWEKYEVKFPQAGDGEEFRVNQGLYDGFRQFAHKEGLSNSQAQRFFDWYLNFQVESEAREDKEFEDLKKGLKVKHAGLYTRKMEAARRAAGKYLGEDADELIGRISPKDAVRIVEAFAEIGDPMLEDAMIEGEKLGVTNLDEVDKKILAMFNDPNHPLNDISKPGHKEAVEEYSRLQKMKIQLTKK